MADDLEIHVLSIEGEGPSSDFVANLRKQLVAEMTESTTFASDATPLPQQFGAIAADVYRADNLLEPLSFTTTFSLFLQENRAGRIALSNPSGRDHGDLDIVLMSLSVDFARWIEILDDGLAAVPREDLTVDGLEVTRIDIDASSCGEGSTFCRDLGTNEAGVFARSVAGSQHQVWVIEQKGESPLAINVGISDESDSVWFDVGEAIVLSMEFGEPDPDS